MPRLQSQGVAQLSAVSDTLPDESYNRWELTRVPRSEGYNEFHCIPAHWIPSQRKPMDLYTAEGLSTLMGVHKDPDFWSASDAAMRARKISLKDLDERELAIYGTRRSNDYNRAIPWASLAFSQGLQEQWQGCQKDPHVHPFANLPEEEDDGLFGHYGMTKAMEDDPRFQVITGFGMRDSHRERNLREPWGGCEGTWFNWQTLFDWQEIPKRQEIERTLVESPPAGKLLLFISHRWEGRTHPDPTGRQLLGIKVGLTLALAAALLDRDGNRATSSGLPEIMRRYLQRCQSSLLDDPQLNEWATIVVRAASRADAHFRQIRVAR